MRGERFVVAAVADGHGDWSCPRSEYGARFAVEAAQSAAEEFCTFSERRGGLGNVVLSYAPASPDAHARKPDASRTFADDLEGGTQGGETLRHLGACIISLWYDKVMADLDERPLTQDEMRSMRLDPNAPVGDRSVLKHAYGTTLICCVAYDEHLLLLQQGDGRCDVFFADGRIEQPIPWDERCYDVYTTSLCDDDAPRAMRSWVVDLRQDPVAAVFMGSDGIEDSFEDMEGFHCFNCQLAGTVVSRGVGSDLDEFLDRYLSALSEHGSADDMSVAGIIDLACIEGLLPHYDERVRSYQLDLEAREINLSLQSKSRKREALKEEVRKLSKRKEERGQRAPRRAAKGDATATSPNGEVSLSSLRDLEGDLSRAIRERDRFEEEYLALERRLQAVDAQRVGL